MTAKAKEKQSRIPLNALMVFHEVAQRKSFSKAARVLSVSQPAVTKQIRNLESKTGTILIHRDKGNFTLTDIGKILFQTTKKVSYHLQEVAELLEDLQQKHFGELKIGTTRAYSISLFPDLLSNFRVVYPSVKITLNLGGSETIEAGLLTYESDLALVGVTKVNSRFEYTPLFREDLVLLIPPSHALLNKETVSLKDTVHYPFIIRSEGSTTRRIVLRMFNSLGIYPSTLMEVDSPEFIKEWVMRGVAISVVPKSTVVEEEKGLVRTIPLVENLHINVSFVYLKEMRFDPVIKLIRTFINYTRKWLELHKPRSA